MTRTLMLVGRWRYELLALALTALLGGLHVYMDIQARAEALEGRGLGAAALQSLALLEGQATDIKFRLRGPQHPHRDVRVAVVDEPSVRRFGRWPWAREVLARALVRMHEAGVAAVGLDMTFSDEDDDSASAAYAEDLEELERLLPSMTKEDAERLGPTRARLRRTVETSGDAQLAAAFRAAPEVVQGVIAYPERERADFASGRATDVQRLGAHVLTRFPQEGGRSEFRLSFSRPLGKRYDSAQTPISPLAEASPRWAHFNVEHDPDGVIRRVPLFIQLSEPEGLLPALALQTAAVYLHAAVEPEWDPRLGRLVGARLRREGAPSLHVPLELQEPETLVNFVGSEQAFRTLSLAAIIDGRVPPEELRGKAVLVGVNIVGEFDQVVTPFSRFESGVFTQASLLSSILSQRFLTRPPVLLLFELLFMLVSGLLLAQQLPRARFLSKGLGVLALAVLYGLGNYALFVHGYNAAVVLPLLQVFLCGGAIIFVSYLSTDREKAQLRLAFGHYLSPGVMHQVLAHPDRLKLGGEKRELTVLFCDIRGFTTLAESMAPEALVKFVNGYLTPMTQIVLDEGGTLDKYIGDALMAFWGAPVAQADHALRACRAACAFLEKLEELKVLWRGQGLPEFDIGVGINSGPMVVGNMGSEKRFDYTVMGDAVNLGSRLEGTNKEFGTRIIISEATRALLDGALPTRRLGDVQVKGKRRPVRIYQLLGATALSAEDAQTVRCFEEALEAVLGGDPERAATGFGQVLERWPGDGPSRHYLELLGQVRKSPPERAPGA